MFIHNFKYSFKTLFRNKTLIFWTLAFPILLGTFFSMAFSNIVSSEKMDIIDVAVVNNNEFKNNMAFKTAFKELSNKNNNDRIFNTKYVSIDKATELLKSDKIAGYLEITDNKPNIVINKNGIDQTVFKYVVEEINQTNEIINNLSVKLTEEEFKNGNYNVDYEKMYNEISKMMENEIKINDISTSKLDYSMIEFYTLIAMTCLYGGILSMVSINQCLANMSNKGKRVSVSPTKKSTMILSSVLASYVIQLIGVALLFIYTIFVLKIDYGNNIPLIILLAIIGSLAGLALGVFVSSIFKMSENSKTGIIISIIMFWCFFAGMFGITMKYIIDKNIPIINQIDPASMITDGLYSLYYYDTFDRYWFNVISLLIFSIILITISTIKLRRQKYDSI